MVLDINSDKAIFKWKSSVDGIYYVVNKRCPPDAIGGQVNGTPWTGLYPLHLNLRRFV